jgi:two-component system, chemotaxis family, sensor kinase CheA
MPLDNDQIIAEFVVESREHLADVENQLLAIEKSGADIDVELVNHVFRAVHSIKGAAGFFGFTVLGHLAHDLENVLNLIRNRQIVPDGADTNVMLRAADAIRNMIDDIEHSNEVDIHEHLTALQEIATGEKHGQTGETPQAETERLSSAEQSTNDAVERFPTQESSSTEGASQMNSSSGPALSAAEPLLKKSVAAAETNAQDIPAMDNRRNPNVADRRSAETDGRRAADKAPSPMAAGDANIRVSVGVLDSLMNLAGELVLARNQLLQTVGSSDSGLNSVAARLDQVTSELQEAIMQTRMQAVATVFGKFPRVVRDLSNQLGKQCQLFLEGEDVELDKSVIEAIGDPLTHLIRNSVDHGIELPDVRVKAGKSPLGTIVLRAFHQAGKVNITISDDGAGINVARLKEKAIANGIINAEQAANLSDREALRLVFHPGLSLSEKVTSVSGRGVGMDVVKTNIEKLGGAVGIDTEVGRGTTINIRLPLTLAIIPSLIVSCKGHYFAVPQASINELVRVKANEVKSKIERIKRAEVFRLRGKLLPLVRLDAVLGIKQEDGSREEAMHIIVVEAGHLQYGLVVDGVHDSEEIVVKPLGRHMQNCRCMAGATILGDGCVALILDVVGIASHAQLVLPEDDERMENGGDAASGKSSDMQHLLLFSNAPSERFGIPMGVIARLERIRYDQIDSVGGQEVLQYRGGSLSLLTLEKIINAAPRPQNEKIYIVVFSASGREVGLIVPELIDIREVSIAVDSVMLREPGVIGSLVNDGKTVRLLDLFELTRLAHPDWFADHKAAKVRKNQQSGRQNPVILLAEDSTFFRKQVAGFLENDGYEVVACEDGLVAWNTLKSRQKQFDLIITDLEMPNMTGFELSRKIKDDPELGDLPIIALTSLAGEDDMKHGRESGIDDYQIKLDRERLMVSVKEILNKTRQENDTDALYASAGSGRHS